MIIQKFQSYEELSRKAAEYVFNKLVTGLSEKTRYNLGLPTGATPIGMYKELLLLFQQKPELDLTNFHTFNLDEYFPIKRSNPHSYYNFMMNHLWNPLCKVNGKFSIGTNAHIIDGEAKNAEKESERYELLLQESEGLDLTVLGVGINGHIGFNEPGSEADSRTRRVELAPETRQANSRFYSSLSEVPTHAITMGMGTIMDSRELLLLIAGEGKQNVLEAMIQNQVKEDNPATLLLRHPNFRIYSSL